MQNRNADRSVLELFRRLTSEPSLPTEKRTFVQRFSQLLVSMPRRPSADDRAVLARGVQLYETVKPVLPLLQAQSGGDRDRHGKAGLYALMGALIDGELTPARIARAVEIARGS